MRTDNFRLNFRALRPDRSVGFPSLRRASVLQASSSGGRPRGRIKGAGVIKFASNALRMLEKSAEKRMTPEELRILMDALRPEMGQQVQEIFRLASARTYEEKLLALQRELARGLEYVRKGEDAADEISRGIAYLWNLAEFLKNRAGNLDAVFATPWRDEKRILIPGGWFEMGGALIIDDAIPVRRIYVSEFYIAEHDVTVFQYQRFLEETRGIILEAVLPNGRETFQSRLGEDRGGFVRRIQELYGLSSLLGIEIISKTLGEIPDFVQNRQGPDYPIVGLLWEEMNRYAQYRGGWLITPAQYERAAKGPSGQDEYGTPIDVAVIADNGHTTTASVKGPEAQRRVKYWGGEPVMDLSGNVWKATRSRYQNDYYENMPETDPCDELTDPESQRVEVRGGYYGVGRWRARAAARYYVNPGGRWDDVGARVAYPSYS